MVLEQTPEFPDFDLAELPELPDLEGEISATASQDSELDQLLGLSSGFEQEFGAGNSQFSSDLSGDGSLDDLMNELDSDPAFNNTDSFESLGLSEPNNNAKVEQDEFASLLDDIAAESEQPELSQSEPSQTQTLEFDPFSAEFSSPQTSDQDLPDLEDASAELMEDFVSADTIQILEMIASPSIEAFPNKIADGSPEPNDQVTDLDDLGNFLSPEIELPTSELDLALDDSDPFGQTSQELATESSDPFGSEQISNPSSTAFDYLDLESSEQDLVAAIEPDSVESMIQAESTLEENLGETLSEVADLGANLSESFSAEPEDLGVQANLDANEPIAEISNELSENLGLSEVADLGTNLSESFSAEPEDLGVQANLDANEPIAEISNELSENLGETLSEVATELDQSIADAEIGELPVQSKELNVVDDAGDELDMFESELEGSPIEGFTEILSTTLPNPQLNQDLPSDYTQIMSSSEPEPLPSDYTQIATDSQQVEAPKPELNQAIAAETETGEVVSEDNPLAKFILPVVIAIIVVIGGIFALSPKKSDAPTPQNVEQGR